MPCTARVDTRKHQATRPRPPGFRAPSRRAAGSRGTATLGLGRVVRRRVACGLCISPSHTYGADKFNIGFHAPPSRRSQKEGRRASLRLSFPPPAVHAPPNSIQCDQSIQQSSLNPAISSSRALCVLCPRPPVPARRKLLVAYIVSSHNRQTDNIWTHLVSPFAPVPPSPSPTVS